MAITGLANTTASYFGLIIGIYINVRLPLLNTTMAPLGNSFINDDATYGSTPSTGNYNLDLMYTDVRYQILHKGSRTYLNALVQTITTQSNPNVVAYVSSSGIRSLCTALTMPIVIRKFSTNPATEMSRLKNAILGELSSAKVTYSYLGATFLQNLDSHINWLMMMMDTVYDNPASTISSAYSTPSWGMTGIAAANACLLAIKNIKN